MSGGIIRDLLIGVPPQGFRDWRYVVAAVAAGLVCFVFYPLVDRLDRPIEVFNAVGLSLLCVTGTAAALADGVAPFQAAILGAITGIGGGVVRDILLGETPVVLRRNLYAVPGPAGRSYCRHRSRGGFRQRDLRRRRRDGLLGFVDTGITV
jgi:uncharacterized membrane protein YeiH